MDPHQIDIQWGMLRDVAYPQDDILCAWISRALIHLDAEPSEVSVRFMPVEEIAQLNQTYRGKPHSTNVLSFPNDAKDEAGRRLLGDIAVCMSVVCDEAKTQRKSLEAHLAHMLVHGVLHLWGFDHIDENDAEYMEETEVEIMADFGFPDPYQGLPRNED